MSVLECSRCVARRATRARVSRHKRHRDENIEDLSGDSLDTIKASPLLERTTKKGYEVLYVDKPIDEYAVSSIKKYDGKFQSRNVAKGNLDLGDDKEETKRLDEEFTPLTKWIKEQLSDKLEAVRVSVRLVGAPAALVSSLFGWSPQMEKIIRAQALADPVSKHFAPKKQKSCGGLYRSGSEGLIEVLYQTSAMSSGFNLEDPVGFANQIVKLVNQNLNLDPNAKATVEDFPVEEESSDEPQTKDEL
ncbi:Endoplasmin precursor [Planoprotostelium fungivorum]|uniref:Endoplasmin n=1 Tax=Planoprotostelium fungivorum TaxID=1890364 RepID=A0A2P6NWJ1_9EUKA|nr:Endoplasmin precursor [Planoprotostelium fungivorum]